MRLLLFLFSFLSTGLLNAQKLHFEQQLVTLASGEEKLLWISLDEQTDQLFYKENHKGGTEILHPPAVLSFTFGGHNYYSLPLQERYITFFKVYHEGEAFAVLEKLPNHKTLRAVVEQLEGEYSMCQNGRDSDYYLCKKTTYTAPAGFPPATPIGRFAFIQREFEVKQLIYLAIEGKIKLFYIKTDEQFNLIDDFKGPRPGNHKVKNMLHDFIEDENKISIIQKKVKAEKLDIRDPQQLVKALAAAYQ